MVSNIIQKFNKIEFNNESQINIFGRCKVSKDNELTVYHSGSGFECNFYGDSLDVTIFQTIVLQPYQYIKVFIEGKEKDFSKRIPLDKGEKATYTLVSGLGEGLHTIKVLKISEDATGTIVFSDLKAEMFETPPEKKKLKIEVFGDSYSAGYGVLGALNDIHTTSDEDCTLAYSYMVADELNAQVNIFCHSGISIGVPGWITDFKLPDLVPYYSKNDKDEWDFNKYQADIMLIYLGTNDNYGFKQKYGTEEDFVSCYKNFIKFLLNKNPNAKIICLYGYSKMEDPLENTIKSMPSLFNNVFCFKLPVAECSGTNGHPNKESQERGTQALTEYLKNTILPLINDK